MCNFSDLTWSAMILHHPLVVLLGACLRSRMATQRSRKGSEKGSGKGF